RSEHGKLNFLTGFHVQSDGEPVWSIPTTDHRAARLAERARYLAIHPHFGVVVERGFENHRRSGWIVAADALGNRQVDPVPVKAQAASGAALVERGGSNGFPFRIVEIGGAGVGRVVVGFDRRAGRLAIGAGPAEIDFDDPGVAITPLTLDEA